MDLGHGEENREMIEEVTNQALYPATEVLMEMDFGGIKVRKLKQGSKVSVDLRHYYKDRPTKKGIRIPLDMFMFLREKFD